MLAGTAKNLGSVVVDIGGIGPRALLKSVGTAFVIARVSDKFAEQLTPAAVAAARRQQWLKEDKK
jgi:hypothetical protein